MIALDTNIFIYHLISHFSFGPDAKKLFTLIENGEVQAISSVITYTEILTLPARVKEDNLIKEYQRLFLNFPNLSFVPVNIELAHEAALLLGNYPSLKMADALILATALVKKAKALITEDKRLQISGFPLPILNLKSYLSEQR